MHNDLLMAELLCTRLCHDLTGPIGAVNNGAEFLAEEGFNLQSQAVDLITSSAFSAVTRLQFYRMAYGRVRDHGEASLTDKQKMAADFFADSKITLDWPDSHTDAAGVSVSHKMSRLLYNLLIVVSGVLVRGGTLAVRITQPEEHSKQISIKAEGATLKWEPEMEKIFNGQMGIEELNPKNVQAFFTQRLAAELDAKVTFLHDTNSLTVQATRVLMPS
jgi:histidine phosphotransferase ChpT